MAPDTATVTDTEAPEGEFDLDKIRALPTFDVAAHLDTPEVLAAYLSEAFADGDLALVAEALNAASRATGMAEVANRAGIGRESLYKALRPGSQPRLETILGVVKALGYKLVVEPLSAEEEAATE
jgi:probable addiction module antidote protein